MPVFVRTGSIVPIGPVKPYADAPSDEPIELRVYPGESGTFALYDDAGNGYGYQKGEFSLIRLGWDDRGRILSFQPREGSYASPSRFRVVCGSTPSISRDVSYSGAAMRVALPACR